MFIETETTPNPATMKFLPGRTVLEGATCDYREPQKAAESPLAERLFAIDSVSGVYLADDFISVTMDGGEWQHLKPAVLGEIMDHFLSGQPTVLDGAQAVADEAEEFFDSIDAEAVSTIKELIETRVRPAVAQDGGDIIFRGFSNGIVFLHMQGACAGCPSSTMTLKNGIENLLQHFLPEIKEVRQV